MDAHRAHREAYARLGGTAEAPVFRHRGWRTAGDTVELHYLVDGLPAVTETVRFPGHDLDAPSPATAGALDVLHLAAGTSYYKATVPPIVEVPADTSPQALAMLEALLTEGLAEFGATNGLDLGQHARIEASGPAAGVRPPVRPSAEGTDRTAGVVVPVGGGKDSAVTATLAVRAGWDAVAFAVNPRTSMRRTATAVGLELTTAERRLDPRLFAWNDAGALNGHVPITAIVASIACVAAALTGRGDVLLSNEASADEPTRVVGGRAVNHQFSKSSAFEALHRGAMLEATGGVTQALSVLRPLPELLVAGAFVRLGAPLTAVNSCNRAYALRRERVEWCGACPKCLFVQLMLAPFLDPGTFRSATGFDALGDPALVDRFDDLRHPERKPYECVGTVEEVQLAFDLLADAPAWAEHAAVQALGRAGRDAAGRLRAMREAVDTSVLPPRYAAALESALDGLADATVPGTRP